MEFAQLQAKLAQDSLQTMIAESKKIADLAAATKSVTTKK